MLEIEAIRKMAAFCREYGVESLKVAGCEISMYPISQPPKVEDKIPFPEKKLDLSPEEIAHKVEEMTSAMKLDDASILDRFFPDVAEQEPNQ